MRCLRCKRDGVPASAHACPHCKARLADFLHDTLPTGTTLGGGRYVIDYPLGRGDFGITYRAWDETGHEVVAVREFFTYAAGRREAGGARFVPSGRGSAQHEGKFAAALRRFVEVGRAAARVSHPNVVRVREVFEENGTAYRVTDYVGSWRSLDVEQGIGDRAAAAAYSYYNKLMRPVPEGRVRELFGGLVAGMEALHGAGLLQINTDPSNVMLSSEGRPLWANVGEENACTSGYDLFDEIIGSEHAYIPPEAWVPAPLAPRSDVYGLGVLLYEALTGTRPGVSTVVAAGMWKPEELAEPWSGLVASALGVGGAARPDSVREWWASAWPGERAAPATIRCLHCRRDGVEATAALCPQCGVYLPSLLREVLPAGTELHGGKYVVEHALGRGGFGVLYLARHARLGHHVAVKEFYPQTHALREAGTGRLLVAVPQRDAYARALRRFLREGQTLASLSHPGVVRVNDLFEERETAYLVMDLLRGPTLRDELDAQPGRRLSPARAEAITSELAEALEAVHAQGVYHLDIKPDNVILAGALRPVLVDFGASRTGLAAKTTQAYTLEYAAPEVLEGGGDVGPGSDLFELGMMLHEMLTGTRPPNALSRILRDAWRPDELPEEWRAPLQAALRLKREERPASVREWWQQARAKPPAPAPRPDPPPKPSPPPPVAAPPRRRFGSDPLPFEVSEAERPAHEKAHRFARLLVSEIKLYNDEKVREGRKGADLYARLREEIDRSREVYEKHPLVRAAGGRYDYYHHELVTTLAEGDASKMGAGYPSPAHPADGMGGPSGPPAEVPPAAPPPLRHDPDALPFVVSEDERPAHLMARRFARLLVSEIKLYNDEKVREGRKSSDLYARLREDIDRSREMYEKRYGSQVGDRYDYYHHELVNVLTEGDASKMGAGYPGDMTRRAG